MNFNKSFEKIAFLGALAGLGTRALAGAGRGALKVMGGGKMGLVNAALTGSQAVDDFKNFNKKMQQAQAR